ncbi:MAG: hypothetical protein HYT80_03180 [Euryarchaeota archaeon]|nr:hypothetical protein [Euryarchaeota archaeon]
MIALLNARLGTSVEPTYVENPLKNYVKETLADTSKAERQLGWKASTSLEDGIGILVDSDEEFSKKDAENLYRWFRVAPNQKA